jgi:hypothetical protein
MKEFNKTEIYGINGLNLAKTLTRTAKRRKELPQERLSGLEPEPTEGTASEDAKEAASSQFGFKPDGSGGAHISRTMMLGELERLFDSVGPDAPPNEYREAVVEHNCLGKRSVVNRQITLKNLRDLYSLDPSVMIFRALRFFWARDAAGRPLLALLAAYARDPVLRLTAGPVLGLKVGEAASREVMDRAVQTGAPGRFGPATVKSIAQNARSTWTQAGLLSGKTAKRRSRPEASAASLSFALLLGYLAGERGRLLFSTEFAKLLDLTFEKEMELASEASGRGWLDLKVAGDVVEVLFPKLIQFC